MNMRMAIIYSEKEIFVEFPPSVFKKLLKSYYEEYGDFDKAFAMIEKELKKKTRLR
ncbi:unnamed protein product [marine sediment metagenome]|uniref:Uncharacterized protein n=1 Tax=marine sediment metagenome TaxID=412755 RepID=X1ASG8_9ZZZZ